MPTSITAAVDDSLTLLGASDVALFLVDLAQDVLLPFQSKADAVDIDGTVAGRAYRSAEPVVIADESGSWRGWFPVLDGSERIGVLGATLPSDDPHLVVTCARIAGLVAELVVSRSRYGDAIETARRTQELTLAAELRWNVLPPMTFESTDVHLAAVLEPSYDVAGDTFDYSVSSEEIDLAVFDAMGHGLEASRIANLVQGTYRYARRRGLGLVEIYETITAVVASEFDPSRFSTGAIAKLSVGTGELRLLLAGHPPPLLLRNHQVLGEVECRPTTPLGILDHDPYVASVQLEPGDRIVLYTDGVVEARRPTGDDFGVERLADFLVRAESSDEPPAETMRRLAKAVLAHQENELQDDATLLMVHWRP